MKKKKILAILMLTTVLITAGCGSNTSGSSTQTESESTTTSEDTLGSSEASTNTSTNVSSNTSTNTSTTSTLISPTIELKEEDTATEYDSSAVIITLSDQTASMEGSGAALENGILTISKAGTYVLNGEFNGQVLVEANTDDLVHLVLNGVTISCENSSAIYAAQCDKLVITLAEGTTNTVSDGTQYVYASAEEEEPNAAIFSKDDLTINGLGTLIVNGNYADGIRSKDDLAIVSGIYEISAIGDALQGKDSAYIRNGEFTIFAGKDGIKSSNDTETEKGFVTIDGGNFVISATDDALHAETTMTINNGTLVIEESYEGIEGLNVVINGGDIIVNASDDGINSAGGSDSGEAFFGGGSFGGNSNASITINGGTVTVNSDGDGIDSNGSFYVNGGTVFVNGPESNGNASLDYDSEGTISEGTVVAVGSSGMAMGFSTNSTQPYILYNVSEWLSAGETITLSDSNGEILSYTPESGYNSILISSADLTADGTYTLSYGSSSTEITLSGNSYSNGSSQGGFGGNPNSRSPGGNMGGGRG